MQLTRRYNIEKHSLAPKEAEVQLAKSAIVNLRMNERLQRLTMSTTRPSNQTDPEND